MPFLINSYWNVSGPSDVKAFSFRTPPPNTVQVLGTGNVLGYHFLTSINRTLEAIGVYKDSPNLNSIGIWDWDIDPFTPIFQFIHDTSNTFTDDGFYHWYTIPGLPSLISGHDYVIAAAWGQEPVPAGMNPGDFNIAANFALNNNAYAIDVLPSLNADLSDPDYAPIETNSADKKSFLTTNLKFVS